VGKVFNRFRKNESGLATVLDAGPEEMRIENTSSNARFHLSTNGTVIRFDVLLSKLTCSKFDEKRRQSFRSFGRSQLSYVCSPLVCLGADQIDEGREKADSSIFSPQGSLRLSRSRLFDLLVLFKLEKWFY